MRCIQACNCWGFLDVCVGMRINFLFIFYQTSHFGGMLCIHVVCNASRLLDFCRVLFLVANEFGL